MIQDLGRRFLDLGFRVLQGCLLEITRLWGLGLKGKPSLLLAS